MLEKLSIQVAQPSLTTLSFQDDTVTGVSGGWSIDGGVGDYAIEDSAAFKLEQKHHLESVFWVINQGPLSGITFNTLYKIPFQTTREDWGSGSETDKYADGIYTVRYTPYQDDGTTAINTVTSLVLVLGQTQVAKAKMLNKMLRFPYGDLQDEMERLLSRLDVNIEACKAEVLVDNFTVAVKAFNETQTILQQLDAIE